jgi:hypothetical protein
MRDGTISIAMIIGVALGACRGDTPGPRMGPLAPSADSLVARAVTWSCGGTKREPEGALTYCIAQQQDTLLYFAVDSTERVAVIGKQFTVASQALGTRYDSLALLITRRYGVGQQCPSGVKNTRDRRWSVDDSHLLLYSETPASGLTYEPFIRFVRHVGPMRCGNTYLPPLGY